MGDGYYVKYCQRLSSLKATYMTLEVKRGKYLEYGRFRFDCFGSLLFGPKNVIFGRRI